MIEFANVFENYAKVLKRKKFLSDPEHASTLEKTIEQLKASEEYEFARSLRNSATNHYLQDDCASNIDRYKDNHRFIMLWSDQPGNCYFPFAEEIAHLSHFSDDPEVGKDLIKAQRWLHKLATDLINLHHQSLNCILQKYPTEDYGKTTVFADKELVATPDDRLPILFFNGTGSRF